MDERTQALTRDGWKHHHQLRPGVHVLTLDPASKEITWQPVRSVDVVNDVDEVVRWANSHGFNVMSAPDQQWVVAHRDRDGNSHFEVTARLMRTKGLSASNKQLITGGGFSRAFASTPRYEDAFVELIGWVITEGHYQKQRARAGVFVAQSPSANPEKTERIRRITAHFAARGATATENLNIANGMINFYFGVGIGELIRETAPDKQMTSSFLNSLTLQQAELLYQTLLDGDGHRHALRTQDGYARTVRTENFIQKDPGRIDGYQMLAAMLGKRTCARLHSVHSGVSNTVTYHRPFTTTRHLKDDRVSYAGALWCPRTAMGTWLARREGGTFWVGELASGAVAPAAPKTEGRPGRSRPQPHVSGPRTEAPAPGALHMGVDAATEVLTPTGWQYHTSLREGDHILALDPHKKSIRWTPVRLIWRYEWDSAVQGPLTRWAHRAIDALTAPGHRWLELSEQGRKTGRDRPHQWRTTSDLLGKKSVRIVFGSGSSACFPNSPSSTNRFVAELAEGYVSPALICDLTFGQAKILYEAMITNGGHRHPDGGDYLLQDDQAYIDSFQMLCSMLGRRTAAKTGKFRNGAKHVTVYTRDYGTAESTRPQSEDYTGLLWIPELETPSAWCARRNGTTYWTGSIPASIKATKPTVERQLRASEIDPHTGQESLF